MIYDINKIVSLSIDSSICLFVDCFLSVLETVAAGKVCFAKFLFLESQYIGF